MGKDSVLLPQGPDARFSTATPCREHVEPAATLPGWATRSSDVWGTCFWEAVTSCLWLLSRVMAGERTAVRVAASPRRAQLLQADDRGVSRPVLCLSLSFSRFFLHWAGSSKTLAFCLLFADKSHFCPHRAIILSMFLDSVWDDKVFKQKSRQEVEQKFANSSPGFASLRTQ